MREILEPARSKVSPSAACASRPLTICAVGYGSSPHVATRARCFAEMGHRVFLITEAPSTGGIPGVTELVPALDNRSGRRFWYRLLLWSGQKLCGRAFDHVWRLAVFLRMLQQCKPDVVHVHFAYSYYGWLAGLLGCHPLVVTIMGGDILFEEQGSPTSAGKWLTLELLRRADYITSKSNYLTEVLERQGDFGSKTERILWGVSLQRFRRVDTADLRSSLRLGRDRRVIFSPKILQPLYRVHLVVEAIAIVRRRFPEAVLLVAEYSADPAYRANIGRLVQERGLGDHVMFCGQISHSEMPAYYSLAEISIAVPSSDGLPQTLLESMACQTPNILSHLPRYEELVQHEQSAYFVSATADEIGAGISVLLSDDRLRERIAANALLIVQREGDLDQQARQVEARYRHLTATVRPSVASVAGLWATARSYYRFRANAGRCQPATESPKEA
jgi:glycosyltransferase involved in cell wall biosynthesis